MKMCLAVGAFVYTAMIATLLGLFKKFVCVFRSYQMVKDMHLTSANMSVEERNKRFQEVKSASKPCRKAMRHQANVAQESNRFMCR